MRALALRLQLVVAILVAMLAAGSGLPGLVQAFSGAREHVCTCASGGDHTSCPVCNPQLAEAKPETKAGATAMAARGAPCGDPRLAVAPGGEVSTLPAALALPSLPFAMRLDVPGAQSPAVPERALEPATPPPRRAAT